MKKANTYSPEVRQRAVRMVFEHEGEHTPQWACIQSIAEKIGCSGETLRNWVRQAERNQGKRAGLTTDERAPWRGLEDVEFATLEWVWWFNYHRPLEPLVYVPPVEYEEAFYRRQESQTLVPALT